MEERYKSEIVDTDMESLIIGPGKEYKSREDWMGQKLIEWSQEAKRRAEERP